MLDEYTLKNSVLKLCDGVQVILLKKRAFLLGGHKILYLKGDGVQNTLAPLLQILNDRKTFSGIEKEAYLPDIIMALQLLNQINDCGLLCEAAFKNEANTTDLEKFICRVSGILPISETQKRSPLSLIKIQSSYDGKINRLIKMMHSILNRESISYCYKSKFMQEEASVRFCFSGEIYSLSFGNEFDLFVTKIKHDDKVSNIAFPLEMLTAILSHWVIMTWSGFPTVKYLSADWRFTGYARVPPGTQFDFAKEIANISEFDNNIINDICKYSAGIIEVNNKVRRIAPSAGNLGTIQVICCLPDADDRNISVFHLLPGSLKPYRLITIPKFELAESLSFVKNQVYFIFVASTARLRLQYEDYHERLAYLDTGVSVDHARRAAWSYGFRLTHSRSFTSRDILRAIHLPDTDPRLFVTELLIGEEEILKPSTLPCKPIDANSVLESMLRRRSVRTLSSTPPPKDCLTNLEQKLFSEVYFNQRKIDPVDQPILLRVFRDACTLLLSSLDLKTGSYINLPFSISSNDIKNIILQRDLSDAPVIYLVAFRRGSISDVFLQWKFTGEVLSGLWVEAVGSGLSGCIYGNARIENLNFRFPQYCFQEAVLCLGQHPKEGEH